MTETPVFKYYCVAMIDLLGQSDSFAAIEQLPSKPDEVDAFLRGAKATVGRVFQLRDTLSGSLKELKKTYVADSSLLRDFRFSTEEKIVLRRAFVDAIQFQSFSDTVVMYSALRTPFNYIAVYDIYAMLVATATTMLAFLSAGVPLRGGIEMGLALEFDGGDLYGPAVRNAHWCESDLAQYPRIVVGEATIRFLRAILEEKNNDPFFVVAQKQPAGWAMEMLTKDSDGVMIVDVLGSAMRGPCDEEQVKCAHRIFDFAKKQAEHYRGDGKLGPRYRCLLEYCESRRNLWF